MSILRTAAPTDLALLPAVDTAAESLFAAAGLALPPGGTCTAAELAAFALVLVAGDPPVGFAAVDVLDGTAHLAQLSVHPDSSRQGRGRRLVEAVSDWAASRMLPAVTLTTFRDVPWNGPLYRRWGFRELPDPPPGLAAVRRREAALGLDAVGPRTVLMRRVGAALPRTGAHDARLLSRRG